MRLLLAAVVAALAVVVAWPAAGGAANECQGLIVCIPVTGPWVLVRQGTPSQYLLTCPAGAVVGGLDAVATSTAVHVDFVGQVGAPVSPGVTTTRNALVRAVLAHGPARALYQPSLGCIPTSGGGGRATTSARAVVRPGAPLQRFAKNVTVHPGVASFGLVSCPPGARLTGVWSVVYFRTKIPPGLKQASLVQVERAVVGNRVGVTVAASDALSLDLHAGVQVGVECAA